MQSLKKMQPSSESQLKTKSYITLVLNPSLGDPQHCTI